ncbi:MAG: hypothetical protein UY06_C0043G0004 [Candidatus Amesbacteria bacterium GW2011_GWA2_47_70]|nr:MAG: hypothetical protein UY06_C0043G0004 [Candidatus Amesbacteria bacterium GW2011_GWA2_47_70]
MNHEPITNNFFLIINLITLLTNYNLNANLNTMLNAQSIKSFTDLRTDPAGVTQLAIDSGPIYILNRNRPISVLLDVAQYEQLIEELQDARDSHWLAKKENYFNKAKGLTSKQIAEKYHLSI